MRAGDGRKEEAESEHSFVFTLECTNTPHLLEAGAPGVCAGSQCAAEGAFCTHIVDSFWLNGGVSAAQARGWRDAHVIVRKRAIILQLLARKDETLLIWWNALFVLNLGLDCVDRVGRLHLERHCLSRERLHNCAGAGQRRTGVADDGTHISA
jgi:hypothetical protein